MPRDLEEMGIGAEPCEKISTGDKAVAEATTKDDPTAAELVCESVDIHGVPWWHKILHFPAHPNCRVCREAKQKRSAAYRTDAEEREGSMATKPFQKISFDWLDMKHHNSLGHKRYALVDKDEHSEALHWHSTRGRTTEEAEEGVRDFAGKNLRSKK